VNTSAPLLHPSSSSSSGVPSLSDLREYHGCLVATIIKTTLTIYNNVGRVIFITWVGLYKMGRIATKSIRAFVDTKRNPLPDQQLEMSFKRRHAGCNHSQSLDGVVVPCSFTSVSLAVVNHHPRDVVRSRSLSIPPRDRSYLSSL